MSTISGSCSSSAVQQAQAQAQSLQETANKDPSQKAKSPEVVALELGAEKGQAAAPGPAPGSEPKSVGGLVDVFV